MTLIKDPKAPATDAQKNYLASLVQGRDLPSVCERYTLTVELGALTKGLASAWIEQLLAAPKKAAKTPAQAYAVTAQQIAQAFDVPVGILTSDPQPAPAELPAFGYYMIDGTLYYWDCTGKDSYPTLRRLVIVPVYGGGQKGSWKKVYTPWNPAQQAEATWVPYAGKGYNKTPVTKKVTVPQVLTGSAPLSETEAGALGKQFGFCVRCGATLTDPVSVANGIGPVCAKYWG